MIAKTRGSLVAKRAIAVALIGSALLLVAAAPAGAAVVKPTPTETLQEYESELSAGQISAAELNLKVRSIHLTLTSGKHVLVHYEAGQEPTIVKDLRAKGIVPVTPKGKPIKEPKPAKHKLRYIAGGILIAVILIVIAVLFVRRRHTAAAEY